MRQRNRVLTSLESRATDRCVDVFLRPDGSFGFEEFRRDLEDCGQWRSLNRFGQQSFSTEKQAHEAADANVPWLRTRGE